MSNPTPHIPGQENTQGVKAAPPEYTTHQGIRIRNPVIAMPRRGNGYPRQRKAGPPENAVVSGLRKAIPVVIAADIAIMILIIVRIVVNLYQPTLTKALDNQWQWLFSMVPTGGVLLTGMIAVFLVATRLASLESDRANVVMIKDVKVQAERKESLKLQANICKNQMILAFVFVLAYVFLGSLPQFLHIDATKPGGQALILVLTLGEFAIPLLNTRTFAIVEESLKQLDIISTAIYEASNAAMQMLQGIGNRALDGTLSKADRRSLKRAGKGDLDGALETRAEVDYGIDATANYVSLRMLVTGVRDGDMLDAIEYQRWHDAGEPRDADGKALYDTPQETRYNRALAVARRIKESARAGKDRVEEQLKTETDDAKITELRDEARRYLHALQQFDRAAHNQLMVSEEMGGRIVAKLGSFRPRRKRSTKAVEASPVAVEGLAISEGLAE